MSFSRVPCHAHSPYTCLKVRAKHVTITFLFLFFLLFSCDWSHVSHHWDLLLEGRIHMTECIDVVLRIIPSSSLVQSYQANTSSWHHLVLHLQ